MRKVKRSSNLINPKIRYQTKGIIHDSLSQSSQKSHKSQFGKQTTKNKQMKFINYLEKITGVDVYAMTSFLIFFTFFVVMALWAWRADKNLIKTLSHIPLDEENQ